MTEPKTRKCRICAKDKPIDEFRIASRGPSAGKRNANCTQCLETKNQSRIPRAKPQNPTPSEKPEIDLNQKVDLDFLLDLGGWSDQEIKELLLTVKTYRAAPHKMKPRAIYERFFADRGSAACGQIVMEFKEAAEHSLSFDEYMKTGRKFRRDGKKVIAPAKK